MVIRGGKRMKLDKEKISSECYFRVGFDRYSGNYLMETDDTFGNNRYFILTEEQYKWIDTEADKLESLYNECVKKNNKSDIFYFSNWEKENTNEQNRLMWKYTYIDMLIGKNIAEVHKKIGAPSEIMYDGKLEIFRMTSDLTIQVVYSDSICVDVFVVQ